MEPAETKKRIGTVVRNVIGTVVCTLLIISLCVTLTLLYRPLYYRDMRDMKLAERNGVTEEEILENYRTLINYNTVFGPDELEFPTLTQSETGRIHFAEVKKIFVAFQWTGIVCLILISTLLARSRVARDFRWLRASAIVVAGILLAIAAVFLIGGWDNVFVWFHKLAFDNDYWIFDAATDPIINFLPDTFFLHCALMIIINVLIGAGICEWRFRATRKEFASQK